MDEYSQRVYLARVRDFVGGMVFPATAEDIIDYAHRKNTPSRIVTDLDRLRGRQFASMSELVRAIAGLAVARSI